MVNLEQKIVFFGRGLGALFSVDKYMVQQRNPNIYMQRELMGTLQKFPSYLWPEETLRDGSLST